jgi:ribosome-associated toxin RatA of RatAB toxin-antitoxin module
MTRSSWNSSNLQMVGRSKISRGVRVGRLLLAVLCVLTLHGAIRASSGDALLEDLGRGKLRDSVFELPDTVIGSETFVRRAVVIGRTVQEIWPLLEDLGRVKEMIPKIDTFKVLEIHPDSAVVLCRAKPKWYLKTFSCSLFVTSRKCEKMRWVRTGGDFDALECSWEFFPLADGRTLALFSIHFELGGLIPGFLVKAAMKGTLPKMMLHFRDWILEHSVPVRGKT